VPSLYVCSAGDPSFLGEYVASEHMVDGLPAFNNDEGKAVWRHQVRTPSLAGGGEAYCRQSGSLPRLTVALNVAMGQGWWYLGDATTWPPETHYRCVEGCPYNKVVPPQTGFQVTQMHKTVPVPEISYGPCGEAMIPESVAATEF
jgi:hypothetical protein